MRVRDWDDILADVASDSTDPDGWRAVAGSRREGLGEDLYFGHPSVGVYHLKTYAKNPATSAAWARRSPAGSTTSSIPCSRTRSRPDGSRCGRRRRGRGGGRGRRDPTPRDAEGARGGAYEPRSPVRRT